MNLPAAAAPTLIALATGYWISRAIHVAAKLGIADLLADGPRDARFLAQASGSDPDALFRLLRALAAVGILTQHDDCFALDARGEALRTDAAGSLRDYVAMLGGPESWKAWEHLEDAVRTGTPAFDRAFGVPAFQYFAMNPARGAVFDQAMRSRSHGDHAAVIAAYDFAHAGRIVDVGGGAGTFLSAILSAAPRASGTLFDLPRVVATARVTIADSAAVDRIDLVAGDFFTAVPDGADLYVLKQVVHDWSDDEAILLLSNCRRAMKATSRLLILEIVIGADNAPAFATQLDLMMLVSTRGRERTLSEYQRLMNRAGLVLAQVVPTRGPLTILETMPR